MINFSKYEEMLIEDGYELLDGWEELLEEEFVDPATFVSKYEASVVREMADNILFDSDDPITTVVKFKVPDGSVFDRREDALEYVRYTSYSPEEMLSNVDTFLEVFEVSEDSITLKEYKDLNRALRDIEYKLDNNTVEVADALIRRLVKESPVSASITDAEDSGREIGVYYNTSRGFFIIGGGHYES